MIKGSTGNTYGKRQKFASYNLQNLNRDTNPRPVYARLQLSTTPLQVNTKFPLELGTFEGKLTTKQIYEELIATLQAEVEKMPNE